MKKINYLLMVIVLVLYSCDIEKDLNVDNIENPSSAQVGIEATANKLFQNWYQAVNNYSGPGMALAVMSDQMTCSWGNQGMRDTSSEPRVMWDNTDTYTYSGITQTYFSSMYSILADSNAIIQTLQSGGNFSDTDKVESLARFGQAASLGSIALIFDKGWASDENGSINDGQSIPFDELLEIALEKLDLAIAAANNGNFTLEDQINGIQLTNEQWSKFLNSYGARLLSNSARNSQQKNNINWERVFNYADNGLDFDLEVLGDGYNTWYSEWPIYMIYPGWARVDLRVINLMDPAYPDYWPENETVLPQASSTDNRLTSDFTYLTSQDFIASRGTYHYSSYRHSRYDSYTNTSWEDYHPEFLSAENDLYKAEALLHLNMFDDAAQVINGSTRVLRGGLQPINANEEEINNAIHYERMVELGQTGMGLSFFEMRGKDLLQEGTILHFPVPGASLQSANETPYTFGGTTGVAGEDYSNGGWF